MNKKFNVEIDFVPKSADEWNEFEDEEKYKAILTNYYTNSIEFDKLLLALAVGLLGFIITLLLNMNFSHEKNVYETTYILQIIALIFGVITIILSSMTIYSIVKVFETNSKYLGIRIKDNFSDEDLKYEKKLRAKLDILDQQAKDYFLGAVGMIGIYILLILSKNFLSGY